MRDFIIVFTILCVIFAGNYFIYKYIDGSGVEFLEVVKELESNMELPNEEKKKKVADVLKLWEENEEKWIMIGYHQEINDIEDLVIECYNYYLQSDRESFIISYKQLERSIEDLKNREKITFTNIL